jgi:integrase/recombinase XerC
VYLTWPHVNFEKRLIKVTREPGNIIPKGRRERLVGFDDVVADALKAMWAVSPDERGRVFQSWGAMAMPDQARDCLRDACDAIGVERVGPHGLRASFATAAAASGVDLTQLQMVMGHADISTTVRYVRHKPEGAAARVSAAVSVWGKAATQ